MIETTTVTASPPIILQMVPIVDLSDDDKFFRFCQLNRDLRIERTAQGEVLIMTPVGGETSRKNALIIAALVQWATVDGTGVVFDSSGGFVLPNGATRSPDAAWLQRPRFEQLATDQKERFLPLCPDFAIELRSPSDQLPLLQEKMTEYIENGARLAWLIDPCRETVEIHARDAAVIELQRPSFISGDPVLPGFTLDLDAIWEPLR